MYFLTQKIFLSSRKYDLGCSSWIRILIADPGSRIPDPEVIKAPDPGFGSEKLVLVAATYRNFHTTIFLIKALSQHLTFQYKKNRLKLLTCADIYATPSSIITLYYTSDIKRSKIE
jgi:hypothetical protein